MILCLLLAAVALAFSPPFSARLYDPEPASADWFVRPKDCPHCCGGALIAARFAITAGHCVEYFAEDAEILVGTGSASRTAKVLEVTRHPDYATSCSARPCPDDLAILEISEISNPQFVSLGRIAQVADEPRVYAWDTWDGEPQVTRSSGPATVEELQDCADPSKPETCKTVAAGPHACGGDSGGPLVLDESCLLGVLSGNGSGGACPHEPVGQDKYVHVAAHKRWIEAVTGGAAPCGS